MTEQQTPGGKRLTGSLTLVDAIAQSVGFIGPVFSMAFLVPLLVGVNASGRGAGVAAPLSVLIAAVGVLGLGWIIAQYAKRIHAAGSLYDYVSDGLGSRIGTASGILYYCGILALDAAILVMIGGTIHDTLQSEFGVTPLPAAGWDVILLALLAVVLYAGVALSTRAQLVLALVSFLAVLVFLLTVIARAGQASDTVRTFTPSGSPTGLSGVLFGVLYGVLLFTGFETAANLGEETARPTRDIPRAVLISVLAVAGFYVIGSYGQVAGYHFSLGLLAKNSGAPLFGLAGPSAGGGFGSVAIRRLLELVVVLDMMAVMIGAGVSAARGLFALGRDGRLPRGLGRQSRRGTPVVASTAVLAVCLVVIVVTWLWNGFVAEPGTPHYVAVFGWLAAFGGFALAIIYLLMAVGSLRGLRGRRRMWPVYLAALAGGAVTVGAIAGSVYKVTAPTIYAPYAVIAIFAVALVVSFSRREVRPPGSASGSSA
ncbi:MAG: APC family permease, partial [Streptosporangiales bacterium]|nr:APC family permease [Streptosporangiales bacterium]